MTANVATPKYDLHSDAYFADPFATYASMRQNDPVYFDPLLSMWIVTRYNDVLTVSRDKRFSVERVDELFRGLSENLKVQAETVHRFFSDWLVFIDPPRHTRIRKLMSKAFSPRTIANLRPMIQSIVDRTLDGFEGRDTIDLIEDFSFRVPSEIIATVLGVAPDDIEDFKGWAADVFRVPAVVGNVDDNVATAYRGVLSLEIYFRKLIDERRNKPTEDMLSALVGAKDEGDMLSEQELVSTCANVARRRP